jgi:hypothetical protein
VRRVGWLVALLFALQSLAAGAPPRGDVAGPAAPAQLCLTAPQPGGAPAPAHCPFAQHMALCGGACASAHSFPAILANTEPLVAAREKARVAKSPRASLAPRRASLPAASARGPPLFS